MIPSERHITGQEMLQRVDDHGGEATVDNLQDIVPDFAHYLIEFPFDNICARSGSNLRNQGIATIVTLTALGNAAPQLKVHIATGLSVGLTQKEITEAVVQMAVYVGLPVALNSLLTVKAASVVR